MRISTVFATAFVLILLIVILYPVVADAEDRRWITNERGETVGYVEAVPLSDSPLVIRDRDGRTVGVVERKELGNDHVIQDRNSERLGRVDDRWNEHRERRQPRDWRDGPRKRWGSHDDRWGQ